MRLLGIPEMMLVLLLALLIFGPEKLSNLGRNLSNALTEFQLTVVQKILGNDFRLSYWRSPLVYCWRDGWLVVASRPGGSV